MKKAKVYVDTCILSRVIDLRFTEKTGEAIDVLCGMDDIKMVTSSKTLEEFMKATDSKKKTAFNLLFKIISKLQNQKPIIFYPATYGSIQYGMATYGGGCERIDPVFEKLGNIFDKDDTEHIYQAYKNNCAYFLTLDRRTILDRAKEHEEELKTIPLSMKLVNPIGLVEEILSK